MTADDELTILLTLKDRVPFTRRWMAYADRVRLPFHVYLADGGSDDGVERMLADRTAFPHVKYEYVRYPRDTGYTDYWRKIADALSRVRTPFVALADNDDLCVVPGAREAVQFLRDHPDYATCGGQCAAFWITPSARATGDLRLYGDTVEWKCSLDARSLTEPSARDRIRCHSLRASHPAYYHVRRTDTFTRHARILRDLDLADPFLIERLVSFLGVIAGKARQLDSLYLARQWNPPDSAGAAYEASAGDWLGRMLVPSWSRDFTRFVEAAATALAAEDGLTIEEARRSVVALYRLWTAPQMLGDILTEPTVTLSMPIVVGLVRRLLEQRPDSAVRRLAHRLYRRARWISIDAVHGTQVRARRVPNAEEALEPIHQFLSGRASSAPAM